MHNLQHARGHQGSAYYNYKSDLGSASFVVIVGTALMASSVLEVMHRGLEAYFDTVFPGEGLRIFEAGPPPGHASGSSIHRRRSSKLRTTSDLMAPVSRTTSDLSSRSSSSYLEVQPPKKVIAPSGDDQIPMEGEYTSAAGRSLDPVSQRLLQQLASCSSNGSLTGLSCNDESSSQGSYNNS